MERFFFILRFIDFSLRLFSFLSVLFYILYFTVKEFHGFFNEKIELVFLSCSNELALLLFMQLVSHFKFSWVNFLMSSVFRMCVCFFGVGVVVDELFFFFCYLKDSFLYLGVALNKIAFSNHCNIERFFYLKSGRKQLSN